MVRRRRRHSPLAAALWVNAVLLGVIATSLLTRGGDRLPNLLPMASAQSTPPIAGGGGVFLMPGQLSEKLFGVYLLDIDAQTLATYVYDPRANRLKLAAARSYRYDRRLEEFNTADPSPDEVRQLIERQAHIRAGNPTTQP